MFRLARNTKGKGGRFTLPHVINNRLTWRYRAGVAPYLTSSVSFWNGNVELVVHKCQMWFISEDLTVIVMKNSSNLKMVRHVPPKNQLTFDGTTQGYIPEDNRSIQFTVSNRESHPRAC
jgi:hypothetical protein